MEEKLLKIFTQLGFLVLLIWAVSTAVQSHMPKRAKRGAHRHSKGDRWATGIVQEENCQPAAFNPVMLAPGQA